MNRYAFASGYIDPDVRWQRSLKQWVVQSPFYEYTVHVLEDGSGPKEETCDIVEVQAKNKREALIFGLKLMRKKKGYLNTLSSWENPFKGMVVNECPDEDECLDPNDYPDINPEQSRLDEQATY